MKVYIIDRTPSQQRLAVAELTKRMDEERFPYQRLDADAKEATSFLELYDIVDFPAVVVTADDGQLQHSWQNTLPRYEDVSGYVPRV